MKVLGDGKHTNYQAEASGVLNVTYSIIMFRIKFIYPVSYMLHPILIKSSDAGSCSD